MYSDQLLCSGKMLLVLKLNTLGFNWCVGLTSSENVIFSEFVQLVKCQPELCSYGALSPLDQALNWTQRDLDSIPACVTDMVLDYRLWVWLYILLLE